MFKIINGDIHITRGDKMGIRLKVKNGFSKNDKIKFSVVNKKDYSKVLLQKTFIVDENCETYTMYFTNDDTRFIDIISKPVTNWYEIEINGQTPYGYDENGSKNLILYPEAPDKGDEV